MGEQVTYTLNIQVASGPSLATTDTLEIEAYDKTAVTLEAGTAAAVNIQPGGEGLAGLLCILAKPYSEDLSYKVNSNAEEVEPIVLDRPHLFLGSGAVGLLATAPTTLYFDNQTNEDVQIQVLVGRDATP